MREQKGYRDWLEMMDGLPALMSVSQVAEFTGINKRYVTKEFAGWTKDRKGKKLSKVSLAAQLAGDAG